MVKQSRKKLRRSKRKSHKRSTKKMVGGDFTQEENQQLLGMGFTQDDIQVLANIGVGLNIIQMSLNQVNPATGNPFTPQELIQSVNEVNEEMENLDEGIAVPNQENGVAGVPGAPYNDVPVAPGVNHFEEQGPGLNMEDLAPYSPRSVTEMGGRRRKTRNGRKSRKQRGGTVFNEEQLTELGRLGFTDDQKNILAKQMGQFSSEFIMRAVRGALAGINFQTGQPEERGTVEDIMRAVAEPTQLEGGKKRRKSRKQRGGMCFGNGVGANNYDPNFSIYNTRELTLFPYRPTK